MSTRTDTAPSIQITASQRARHLRGLTLAVSGAALWGLSGTAAQELFNHHNVSPQWLVTMRMLGAGIILLLVLRPAFPRRHIGRLLFFAIAGLAAVQYTYLAAIAATNVATATFLQYLSIPFIALYESLITRRPLARATIVLLLVSFGGTMLLVLAGPGNHLALTITARGLVLGLLSALTACIYTLSSGRLVTAHGAWPITTWGFIIGGVFMAIIAPPWSVHATGDYVVVGLLTAFVVIFGSLIAFGSFLASLAYIPATEASIGATVEPVVAAIAGFTFLHIALLPLQYLGGALVVCAVTLLRTVPSARHNLDT